MSFEKLVKNSKKQARTAVLRCSESFSGKMVAHEPEKWDTNKYLQNIS